MYPNVNKISEIKRSMLRKLSFRDAILRSVNHRKFKHTPRERIACPLP